MKKFLFMLPSLRTGGMERVFVTIANLLVRAGNSVTAVTFNPEMDMKGDLDEKVEVIYKEPKKHLGKIIPYIRHTMYDNGLWETRASARQLYKYYIGDNKYDIEIAFFRGRCVKIISGSTNPDSLKLAWVHNDFSRCEGVTKNFNNMDEVKDAYSCFDKILCVSEQVRKEFIKNIGLEEKAVVCYNPIPVDAIREKSVMPCDYKKQHFAIMSIGRLMPAKGYDRLIKACARLQREGYDLELVIIGGGNEQQALETLARQTGVEHLTMTGMQDNPFKYIRSADLYVCSSRYEGFNLTVAEALALGLPVLTTDCAGPPEILRNGKYGMIVENSAKGLYNGIKQLINNPELLKGYKEKSQGRTAFFDEKSYLQRFSRITGT